MGAGVSRRRAGSVPRKSMVPPRRRTFVTIPLFRRDNAPMTGTIIAFIFIALMVEGCQVGLLAPSQLKKWVGCKLFN